MSLKLVGRVKSKLPYAAIFLAFVVVSVLALCVAGALRLSGGSVANYGALLESRESASNILVIMGSMFGFTGLILFLRKHRKNSAQSMYLLFLLLVNMVLLSYFSTLFDLWRVPRAAATVMALLVGGAFTALLVRSPEWYVVDVVGILLSADASMMLGVSMSVPLLAVLLAAMAVYDAVSVYKTRHMLDLAEVTIRTKLPLVLYIPRVWGFRLSSLEGMRSLREQGPRKRDVFILGLGDIIFPVSLAVSAFYSMSLTVSLSTLIGTFMGLGVLEFYVARGRPQAGLPFLCSGAILGCISSALLLGARL